MKHLAFVRGGEAHVVSIADDEIVLSASIPTPPGSRHDATLASGETVRFKSHGSHREEDGTFTIKGRLIDAKRELREALAMLVASLGER